MTKKVHTTAGICTGVIISFVLFEKNGLNENLLNLIILSSGSFVGSLIPDIDNTRSYIGHKVKSISKAINKYSGHRGITHSILGLIIFIILLLGIGHITSFNNCPYYKIFLLGLFAGYVSHLAFDIITVGGIPLFYPFKKKFRLFELRSDKYQNFISIICIVLTIFILIYLNYSFIVNILK